MKPQFAHLAAAATDQTELERYSAALMQVRDPELAARAAQFALSSAIPPQAESLRLGLIFELAREHQTLAWKTFTANSARQLAPEVSYAPLIVAQYLPQIFWSGLPLADLETWVRSQLPAEMAPVIARGMESARFRLGEKSMLVAAAVAF